MKIYLVKEVVDNQIEVVGCKERNSVWNSAEKNSDFTYPWEDDVAPNTTFMALHDSKNFYFRYEVEATKVNTFVDKNHKLEVVDSERVELFFCRNKKLNPYYCLELDAHGRVLDYVTRYYRNFDYEWSWEENNLKVKASEYKGGYVVEGAITLDSLRKYELLKNNEMLTGLYRGYCTTLPTAGTGAQLRWISWINPEVEEPDFHIPSSFGKLIFE